MIHRDYIMRMIQLFASGIQRILNLKAAREYPEAKKEIDELLAGLTGTDADLVRVLSAKDIIAILKKYDTPGEVYSAVAELLFQAAEIKAAEGQPAESDRVRSFSILVEGYVRRKPDSTEPEPLIGRYRALRDAGLPLETRILLVSALSLAGRYDLAEDQLFDLLEEKADVYVDGRQFFELLLTKSDAELNAGGLPREEVRSGYEEFLKKIQTVTASGEEN